MPDGARCRTARNAKERMMPRGATRAQDNSGATAARPAVRGSASFLPLSALWHYAPSGISRRMASCGPRHQALFCPALLVPAPLLPAS